MAEAGKTILELPKLWLRPQDEVVGRVVKVTGWELVEAAWQAGRGILFLTPHLGCFEITAQYYAAHYADHRAVSPPQTGLARADHRSRAAAPTSSSRRPI